MPTIVPPRFDLGQPKSLILDLANPQPKDVVAIVETFESAMKANPDLGKLPVKTGWNDIDPAKAIALLMRNRPGANRKVDPATVFYYARQMADGDWKATGQPILIDTDEKMADGQHRLYGALLSGTSIKTFVVTGVEAIPNLFAYIDNSRPRTAATALQTAGFNGVAPVIAKVIKLAEEIRLGVYNPSGIAKLPRMTPVEVLHLSSNYPNAQPSARAASSDWSDVVAYLGGNTRKDLVAYLGMAISDLHGSDVADEFLDEVAHDDERQADDPIGAVRKMIDKDLRSAKPMKRHHVLAALIKTFNAWHKGESLGKRWMLQVNEDFPTVDASGAPEKEAA